MVATLSLYNLLGRWYWTECYALMKEKTDFSVKILEIYQSVPVSRGAVRK
jgi:hypothetical protein